MNLIASEKFSDFFGSFVGPYVVNRPEWTGKSLFDQIFRNENEKG